MKTYKTKALILTLFTLWLGIFGISPGYTLTLSEAQKLLPSSGNGSDFFGHSVSISEETAVIGAIFDDDNGTRSGAAYVYVLDGSGVWREQQKLTASDGVRLDEFSFSVSSSGDTVVIGAFRDDDNGSDSGSAYVFVRNSAGVWREQQKLTASDGAVDDWFGRSVSLSGDTVVIGAPGSFFTNEIRTGSAYVYVRDGTGVWREQQKLTASDGARGDWFGQSVSLSGTTTVIGAFGDDDNGGNSGSAYVYVRDGTGVWHEQQKLTASDGSSDWFGESVSLSGDTAVIAAKLDNDKGRDSGSAYVFVRHAARWNEQQKLTASDGTADDTFGQSVSLSGDTAVIAALRDDDNGTDSGSAYVFIRDGVGMWNEEQKLTASDGAAGDFFGHSVSVSQDTAVIGAPLEDFFSDESGSAYIFEASDSKNDQLAILGDINGDGSEDVAVLEHDTAAGTVTATVKDAEDDHLIQQISFNPDRTPVAFEVMADIDGNGAPELVVLGEGSVSVEVRDSLSGVLQNTVAFNPAWAPIDLAILADQNGNGIPELAVLARSSVDDAVSVVVKDTMTKQYLNYVGFNAHFTPLELAIIDDLNGNAKVELAVLGVDATTAGHDKVEIRDSATDVLLNNVFYSPSIQAKRLVIVPDQNANAIPELAVLRQGSWVEVRINDALNDVLLNKVGYTPSFKLSQVFVIPDLNGNGVPELGVLGTSAVHDQIRVQIRDALTDMLIRNVYFNKDFRSQDDVAVVDDINGNGSPELVYLGKRESDGKLRVIIRDSLTKAVINTVDF